jgi:hypothetical protein
MDGGVFGAAATAMANTGNAAEAEPSETEMTTLPYGPTSLAAGVPERRPVVVLNEAQVGLLAIENESACPSGSDAVGWNEYAWPAVTLVAGVPLMTGGPLIIGDGSAVTPALTVIENAGNDTQALFLLILRLSVTEMTMDGIVPTSDAAGVPYNAPVVESKEAQAGRPWILKLNVSPSASLVVGLNE